MFWRRCWMRGWCAMSEFNPALITKQYITDFIRLPGNEARTNPGALVGGSPTACHYAEPDGTPSCVIGNVLASAGCNVAEIESINSADLLPEFGVPISVAEFAGDIQSEADKGHTWGEALDWALVRQQSFGG